MAHVLALDPNPFFFLFLGTFIQLGGSWDKVLDLDLDQGLTIKVECQIDYRQTDRQKNENL